MFTLIPWCDSALILFCEFGKHQQVFWQKLRASFAYKNTNSFLKGLYCFLTFKRKEEKLETRTWAGVVFNVNKHYVNYLSFVVKWSVIIIQPVSRNSCHLTLFSNQSHSSIFLLKKTQLTIYNAGVEIH